MRILKSSSVALKPLRGRTINGKKVRLREKKLSDARADYTWQSDPELCRYDAVQALTMPFTLYLLDYATEIKRPRRNRFPLAIENLEGKHIGNCTCYEIDEKKGETQLGIMIGDPAYRDKGFGRDVVSTMVDHVFSTTSLGRIYLKTLDWNMRAQRCFARSGFEQCGQMRYDGYNFILMDITRQGWEKGRREAKEYPSQVD